MLSFLFSLLLVVIILGVIYSLIGMLMPEPFKKFALAIVLVIFLVYLVALLTGNVHPFPILRHW